MNMFSTAFLFNLPILQKCRPVFRSEIEASWVHMGFINMSLGADGCIPSSVQMTVVNS